MKKITLHILIVLLVISTNLICGVKQKAFPEAEGFGAFSIGGRGGKVCYVENLNDSGPGSFRNAIEQKEPRNILFKVSGIIELESPLIITAPFVTIAGQTAPGDGICLKNFSLNVQNTHDIIIRYLRVRPGAQKNVEQDAISVFKSQNVIIDHCSVSWGTDETLSVTGEGTNNVTVQWCIISESLNNSVHHKGKHGYGSLIRIDGNISFHHNLFSNHFSRNPRPGAYGDMLRGSFLDFRNNLVYNWGMESGYSMTDKTTVNLIGNYYKKGPSTQKNIENTIFAVNSNSTNLYASDNLLEHESGSQQKNWNYIAHADSVNLSYVYLPCEIYCSEISTETPAQAYLHILEKSGSVLPQRDKTDTRLVDQVKNNSGKIIDKVEESDSWNNYQTYDLKQDSDLDGMPDYWEKKYSLNLKKNNATSDSDNDGYTDIEEYLNGTNPKIKEKV